MIHINGNLKKKKTCKVHQVKLCNNRDSLAALDAKFNSFCLKKEELKAECSPKYHSCLL